jgi:hypothetical protein
MQITTALERLDQISPRDLGVLDDVLAALVLPVRRRHRVAK